LKSAAILLDDGTTLPAQSIGYDQIMIGEIVFNTSMTGYQEIITDPSYDKQIVTFTNPHIGNTGINLDDYESTTHGCSGIIIRNYPTTGSSWRNEHEFIEFLKDKSISAVCSVDTRYLTSLLRNKGSLKGCIVPDIKNLDKAKMLLSEFSGLNGLDLARNVTTKTEYSWNEGTHELINIKSSKDQKRLKVFAYDYGIKKNILRILYDLGCDVTVIPADRPFDELLMNKPDGVFLSNGPGDPAACDYAINNIKNLLSKQIPIFGICLGFQLLCLASGAKTYKMKFGHHGANHPVINLETNKVYITSQNHGFAVNAESLTKNHKITHKSLFDESLQGIELTDTPAYGFQGHPEASPGPQDIYDLFSKFINNMRNKNA
jgi:carbamoyl-phosphate synthase small subunit